MVKRIVFALGLAGVMACNKPSEESCKAAIENMRKLMGTASYAADITPYIRSCRGGSTKAAVDCAIKAKTREELSACSFAHFDDLAPAGSGSGSGSGSSSGSGSGSAK